MESETGQGDINHLRTRNGIVLFARENKKLDGMISSYVYLGVAEYIRHKGNMPITHRKTIVNIDLSLMKNDVLIYKIVLEINET